MCPTSAATLPVEWQGPALPSTEESLLSLTPEEGAGKRKDNLSKKELNLFNL